MTCELLIEVATCTAKIGSDCKGNFVNNERHSRSPKEKKDIHMVHVPRSFPLEHDTTRHRLMEEKPDIEVKRQR